MPPVFPLALTLAAALVVATPAAPLSPRPQIGDPAPSLDAVTLAGVRLDDDLLRGHVTVVEFFATWCVPCRSSLEDLSALRARLGPEMKIVIVAADDAAAVRKYFAERSPPEGAEVALDPGRSNGPRWGQDRFPTTFFVDASGVIRHINRGHGPGFRARADGWLRAMLARRQDSYR
jgi:cytochrome c biogenesis protein CcmG/thiol:disulfide interchange protein DsbE